MSGTGETLVQLAVVHDVALGHIMRTALAAHGIEARLFDSNLTGVLGGAGPGARLMVPAADAARARRLLDLPPG